MKMKPFSERTPNLDYRQVLRKILDEGDWVNPIQGGRSKMVVGAQMRFKFENGFPLLTERDLSGGNMRGAIGEIVAFMKGARTQTELANFGCKWWSRWVTKEKCEMFGLPEGDLGPGSYGAAFHDFPTKDGGSFNQFEHLIKQMIDKPFLRTHIISPWIPPYTPQHKDLRRQVVVAPCHGWLHFLVFPETKELVVHHYQRSGDMPVGVAFNIIQYAAVGMMVAHLTGLTMRELVHTVSDAHIYEAQFPFVEELLKREPRAFPTVTLEGVENVKSIFDFRPEHFKLHDDYKPHEKMVIPTPV